MSKLLFAVALTQLGGCPLLDVEVEVPEVCVGYHDLPVDGVATDGVTTTLHERFAVDDLDALHQVTDLDADVGFVRAALLARAGITDFGFVDAARIAITSDDPALPPLVLYQCDGDCVPADGALDMLAAAQHDALDYLRGSSLVVDIELTGRIPREAWAMDVDICFTARARYQY